MTDLSVGILTVGEVLGPRSIFACVGLPIISKITVYPGRLLYENWRIGEKYGSQTFLGVKWHCLQNEYLRVIKQQNHVH